eukprot:7047604-Pyramimonas_sp.AAC.1
MQWQPWCARQGAEMHMREAPSSLPTRRHCGALSVFSTSATWRPPPRSRFEGKEERRRCRGWGVAD